MTHERKAQQDSDPTETKEWVESLESVLETTGAERVNFLFNKLHETLHTKAYINEIKAESPYINSIPPHMQKPYPGDWKIEEQIMNINRWNAAMMVARVNKKSNLGGHISSYQSASYLYEVGFNHFFRGKNDHELGDYIFFQGHIAPGVYARAFLEDRISEKKLENFRQELAEGGGLSSYPHPRLMNDFWQFPTVSMGIGPMMGIYLAKFARYLRDRGLQNTDASRVWCFLGDGEMDEPESLGNITVAAREGLDNLVYVVNCNLQRLDGPVRGNAKIVQELEGIFVGAGWDVVKVLWGSDYDELFEKDKENRLLKILNETVDGELQKLSIADGAYIRKNLFGKDPEVLKLIEHLSDEELENLNRGGHDYLKVFNAYHWATTNKNGRPKVILVNTIKGHGLLEGAARNSTHQKKKLADEEILSLKKFLNIPISDEEALCYKFYHPGKENPLVKYLHQRRETLGGYIPRRFIDSPKLQAPLDQTFDEFLKGSAGREVSTTMGHTSMLSKMLKDPNIGKYVVPIIPDEARTFGMESLFRQVGIYSSCGQLYEPVDKDSLLFYNEKKDGQVLEEGINEAGSMCSFIAAGCSYAHFKVPMIPFYTYYSMFGFQRVGDFIWASADTKARGFLVGATAGRTTLNGEGLQHQDGHSHILASTFPNLQTYDPAYVYELAAIVKDGIKKMYVEAEDIFYYLTVYNENFVQPPMPSHVKEEDIVRGMYLFEKGKEGNKKVVNILTSGITIKQVLAAKKRLEEDFDLSINVWSVPSFKALRDNALKVERERMLSAGKNQAESSLESILKNVKGGFLAATEYMRSYPEMIYRWIPGGMTVLGTDGFGRSDTRERLRDYFEVDEKHIGFAAIWELFRRGEVDGSVVEKAQKYFEIRSYKRNPFEWFKA